MARHSELQARLEALSDNVYFQPPSGTKMQYPCIVFQRGAASTRFADDNPYSINMRYEVTLIAREPDSEIWTGIASLPSCTHDRFFVAGNLNHDVFNLYF